MPRSINEGVAAAPLFTPHRAGVVVADAAVPSALQKFAHGMDSRGWDEIVAAVKLGASATIEVLLWNGLTDRFVSQSPAVTFALTASAMIRFKTGGSRFFLHCSGVGLTTVDIDVAGAIPSPEG